MLAVALPHPAPAQEAEAPPEAGRDLMQRGAELLLRGLMDELKPELDRLGLALREAEPRLRELLALVDDLRNYEAPVMLENGDILIRRRPDSDPPPDRQSVPPGDEIEL